MAFVVTFDKNNMNWHNDQMTNELFLKGLKNHYNNVLQAQGFVFLNDILQGLNVDRVPVGQIEGWLAQTSEDHIEFHQMLMPDGTIVIGFQTQGEIYTEI